MRESQICPVRGDDSATERGAVDEVGEALTASRAGDSPHAALHVTVVAGDVAQGIGFADQRAGHVVLVVGVRTGGVEVAHQAAAGALAVELEGLGAAQAVGDDGAVGLVVEAVVQGAGIAVVDHPDTTRTEASGASLKTSQRIFLECWFIAHEKPIYLNPSLFFVGMIDIFKY